MANNKDQHYVPRVHLKPFTLDGKGLAINLLNIHHTKTVQNAAVKGQSSHNYFYGNSGLLERAINSVENAYGNVVRLLMSKDPALTPLVRAIVRQFAYLQYLRTEAAARKTAEMTIAMSNLPGSGIQVPCMREAMKVAVQVAMRHFVDTMEIVDDLKVAIIRNRTDHPFVTSDNPAVLTNRLHVQRRHRVVTQSFGTWTAGAIFLLPLSPTLCAILYDPAVYQVSQQRDGWIDVTREADIDAVNEHQILNCAANLYFRGWDWRDRLVQQALACRNLRPEQPHTVSHAVLDRVTERDRRYVVRDGLNLREEEDVLVHITANHPKPSTWPSFLRFRADAKAYSNGTSTGLVRKWCFEQGFAPGDRYQKVKV